MTDKITSYKDICFKLGFVMVVFFISSSICTMFINYLHLNLLQTISVTAMYISRLSLSAIFFYGVPIIAAAAIFKEDNQESLAKMYKKPPRLSKALGNFPSMYGLGQIVNVLVLIGIWIAAEIRTTHIGEETLERSFGTMDSIFPPNITCGVVLAIHMIFAAAIFEEFLCRGILLNALKPYGHGFAIIVTGFLFGIMHGNFHQFSYAFILGIALAYITIQTGSILAATILHAMFNSVAAIMMLFLSTETIQNWLMPHAAGTEAERNMGLLAAYGMFIALFIGLLIAGIALAVRKIMRLKSYRAENPFPEISTGRKYGIFLTSIPVILTILLTIDAFMGRFVASKLYEWLWG